MRWNWKFVAVTGSAGLVIGLGVVGWLDYGRLGRRAAPSALNGPASSGAIPLIDTPTPSATPGLAVVTNGNQGLSSIENMSGGQSSPTPMPLPGPSGFTIYDQYKTNAAALYIDTKSGEGATVAQGSKLTVAYEGWRTSGTVFGAASEQQPFTFTEGDGKVIVGFEEGVYGMKVGGERRLIVPPSVGYGEAVHGSIPGGSVLVFDVVLLDVH